MKRILIPAAIFFGIAAPVIGGGEFGIFGDGLTKCFDGFVPVSVVDGYPSITVESSPQRVHIFLVKFTSDESVVTTEH